jgi:hypothetical protein
MLDGGSPFYAVYETADGRHMAVPDPGGVDRSVRGDRCLRRPGGQPA